MPFSAWRGTAAISIVLCLVSLRGIPAQAQQPTAVQDSAYAAAMNAGYASLREARPDEAIAHFERAIQINAASATAHFQLAYTYIAVGRPADAARRLEEGLARDNENDTARRQLGYLYAELGRTQAARTTFEWLVSVGRGISRDHLAIGNLAARERDNEGARQAFMLAAAGADVDVARDATRGLRAIADAATGAGIFAELYLAPFYQDRFNNTVGQGFLRVGVRGGGWWQPSAYLSVRATRDSRSTTGQQLLLLNDNTAIPAVGVRVRPGRAGLLLYVELGKAYDLVDETPSRWETDFRAGANYTFEHERPFTDAPRGVRLVSEVAADASFYERFDRNVIAYAQLRESLRIGGNGRPMFDVYVRGWGAADTRGDFFNRAIEGGGGVALHLPVAGTRVSVYADWIRGRFLFEPPPLSAQSRSYSDMRVTLVTGLFRFHPFDRP